MKAHEARAIARKIALKQPIKDLILAEILKYAEMGFFSCIYELKWRDQRYEPPREVMPELINTWLHSLGYESSCFINPSHLEINIRW